MTDHLQSWNDGSARQAIVEFVAQVTNEDGAGYVPPEARVAVFDNDGTLWCERPMAQGGFIVKRLVEVAEEDPSLRQIQPWKMAYERNSAWVDAAVVKHYDGDNADLEALLEGVAQSFSAMSVERFGEMVNAYFESERHPRYRCSYVETAYVPMIELLHYLEANAFVTYIVSGGGRDFMRPFAEDVYGIPPERIVGSSSGLSFVADERGAHVMREAVVEFLNDGPVKPISIWDRTGRRPILAGGNANGDVPMLQFAGGRDRPALRLLVRHDDGEREAAYEAGAERALALAAEQGWTVVSMRDDWRRVFSFEAG